MYSDKIINKNENEDLKISKNVPKQTEPKSYRTIRSRSKDTNRQYSVEKSRKKRSDSENQDEIVYRSKNSQKKSRENRSRSRERKPKSKDRRSRSRERKHKSKEHRSRSRERKHKSKEYRSRSRERKHESKDHRNKSKEQKYESKDNRSGSKERRHKSRERRHKSKESRHKSRERRHKSRERRHKSKERRDRSKSKNKIRCSEKSQSHSNENHREESVGKCIKEDIIEENSETYEYDSDEFLEMLPKSNTSNDICKEIEAEDEIDPLDAYMLTLGNPAKVSQMQTLGEFNEDPGEENDEFHQNIEVETLESITQSLYDEKKQKLPDINHEKVYYRKYNFNLYKEIPEISNMTAKEVKDLRRSLAVIVKGKDCPKPITKWSHAIVSMKILNILKYNNMINPTPIQCQTIPAIMSGKDVIGIAKTGSGKTLAYLMPLIRHIHNQPRVSVGEGPIAIILCPTRELCIQIHQEIEKITFALKDVACGCIYGGADTAQQISRLKSGVEIVVGTPGRIIDIMATNGGRNLTLSRCTFIVLDEADRMFDMGFEPQVMAIISRIRPDRQTVMFSATFPRRIEAVAKKIMKDPMEIRVDGGNKVCADVIQKVYLLDENDKFLKLVELLSEFKYRGRCLIFVETQDIAQTLFNNLTHQEFNVSVIHGGLTQEKREEGMFNFKSGNIPVLIATSIAARGLDVKDLMMVINYDCPNHYEDYVHRCGRTGRAGTTGYAYTFVTSDQEMMIGNLIKALKENAQEVPKELSDAYSQYTERMTSQGKSIKAPSGFRGHGFKFDAAEAMKEKNKKLQELQKYCPDEITEEDEAILEEMKTAAQLTSQVPENSINLQKSLFDAHNHAKAAHQMAMKLNHKLDSSGVVIEQVKDISSSTFEEIPINNLPANIRYLLTTKDLRTSLSENYDVTLTVKGTFMLSKDVKKMELIGEKPLHLVLESDSSININSAKNEICRVVKESMKK